MSKKNLLSIFLGVLVVAFTLGAGVLLSSCGHEHTFSDWEIVNEASCTHIGLQKRFCTGCNIEETEVIEMLPHEFGEWDVLTEQTCEQDGKQKHICHNCKFEETITLKATGHTEMIIEGVKPTCEKIGYTEEKICSVCKKVLKSRTILEPLRHRMSEWKPNRDLVVDQCNGTHSRHCLNENCNYVENGDCEYKTIPIKPTCENRGYSIHTCEICNDSFEHDIVEATGHNWSGVYTLLHENGNYYHIQNCLNPDCTSTNKELCDFDTENGVIENATCTLNGTITYSCKTCKQEKKEFYEKALGHLWTLDGQGNGFSYLDSNPNHHERTCKRPECSYSETKICVISTSYKDATCTEDGKKIETCVYCSNITETKTTSRLGHAWSTPTHTSGNSESDSYHHHFCERKDCNEEETLKCEFVDDDEIDATCDEAGSLKRHCKDCKYSYVEGKGEALGHDFENSPWQYYSPDETGKARHIRYCSRNHNHTEIDYCEFTSTIDKNPNCEEAGIKKFTCDYCSHSYTEDIPALGHIYMENEDDYNEWERTETHHTGHCQRAECNKYIYGEHTFIASNLCDVCGYDGLKYEVRDGYAVVLSDSRVSKAKKIIIASEYKGFDVEEIVSGLDLVDGSSCGFMYNNSVEEVVLPNTLKRINSYAFSNCSSLKNVSIDGTPSLEIIGRSAFENCINLLSANLPNSLHTIGRYAFNLCKSLAEISIPESVVDIREHAFRETAFVKNSGNWDKGVLYINKHLIKADTGITSEYEITDGTVNISAEAFLDCITLQTLTIPSSVIEIDMDAFKNCVNLTKIIYKGTFMDWLAILFANDAASPMSVASSLEFDGEFEEDAEIVIPENVKSIPAGAFKNTNIKSVTIHDGVTSIGEEAFENCSKLETVITLGDISYIGLNAFSGTAFYDNDGNWENNALYVGNCLVKAKDTINADFAVKQGTISISPEAFKNNLTITRIVFNASLVYIGENAFVGCSNLKNAKFEDSLKWFAKNHMIGRMLSSDELNGKNEAKCAGYLTYYYTGEWIKSFYLDFKE